MTFVDRRDAGDSLEPMLLHLVPRKPVVLGLPRGGVPVAAVVAHALGAPLDASPEGVVDRVLVADRRASPPGGSSAEPSPQRFHCPATRSRLDGVIVSIAWKRVVDNTYVHR